MHNCAVPTPRLNLVQWYGRNKNFLPTVKTEKISQLSALKQTDLLLLCIKDDALATLAQKITVSGLVVHTSGSVHINVLEQHSLARRMLSITNHFKIRIS